MRTVWLRGGCDSWYLDDAGVNRTLYPGPSSSFWRSLRRVRPEEYRLTPAPAGTYRGPLPDEPAARSGRRRSTMWVIAATGVVGVVGFVGLAAVWLTRKPALPKSEVAAYLASWEHFDGPAMARRSVPPSTGEATAVVAMKRTLRRRNVPVKKWSMNEAWLGARITGPLGTFSVPSARARNAISE